MPIKPLFLLLFLLAIPVYALEAPEFDWSFVHVEEFEEIIEEEIKEEPVAIDQIVLCNCYKYAEIYTGLKLPKMVDIHSNVDKPEIGDIAIMFYGEVKHVAVVTDVSTSSISIAEGNYNRCQETKREIEITYSRLVGFYRP